MNEGLEGSGFGTRDSWLENDTGSWNALHPESRWWLIFARRTVFWHIGHSTISEYRLDFSCHSSPCERPQSVQTARKTRQHTRILVEFTHVAISTYYKMAANSDRSQFRSISKDPLSRILYKYGRSSGPGWKLDRPKEKHSTNYWIQSNDG